MEELILDKVSSTLSNFAFIQGIVLGGSRATNTATSQSDIDIGIYYDPIGLEYPPLQKQIQDLDDEHRDKLLGKEGDWGNWVNFGAWLKIEGIAVDLIFRDINRVAKAMQENAAGIFSSNYQVGHPHAYFSHMYQGELASSKLIFSKDQNFINLKTKAENYPLKLQEAIIQQQLFEAVFSLTLANKAFETTDLYYITGHIFRSISALNQVLFAKNKVFFLNEKRALKRIDHFDYAPSHYEDRVHIILNLLTKDTRIAFEQLNELIAEIEIIHTKLGD
ncbi:nucleotidyltransferase domain-containing protein [Sphingobacterium sp. HJSM2_6]|uniref:nucleotidyltransferase domain-containing protein n=1 Tax=Sphingobacterium sp. HJSM2_6 TaxID=3366264 RepID=UPI003BE31780